MDDAEPIYAWTDLEQLARAEAAKREWNQQRLYAVALFACVTPNWRGDLSVGFRWSGDWKNGSWLVVLGAEYTGEIATWPMPSGNPRCGTENEAIALVELLARAT